MTLRDFYVGLKRSAKGRKWDEKMDRVRVLRATKMKKRRKENAKKRVEETRDTPPHGHGHAVQKLT